MVFKNKHPYFISKYLQKLSDIKNLKNLIFLYSDIVRFLHIIHVFTNTLNDIFTKFEKEQKVDLYSLQNSNTEKIL